MIIIFKKKKKSIKGRAFLEVISLVVENYSCHNNGFCSLFTLSKNSRLIFT